MNYSAAAAPTNPPAARTSSQVSNSTTSVPSTAPSRSRSASATTSGGRTKTTWNRVALIQTQSQVAAQIAARERTVHSVRADWRPLPAHTFFASASFTNDNVSSRIYTATQAYGTGATGGEHFTQGAATGVGTTTLGTTYREQLKDTGALSLGHRFEDRGWKIATTLARSQSRRRTLSAGDGHEYFGTTSATIPNLILRADGYGGERFGTPPVVRGTSRTGQPVAINDGRLYSLSTATSPQEPLMTNALTTLKLHASRELGLPFTARLMAGVDVSRNERDIRVETSTWNFRPTFAAGSPERLAGSYDLINDSYSAQRSFANGESFQWIDPRKVYELYKAQPSYFVLNEAAFHISRVNGSQKLAETVSAGFLRTDLKFSTTASGSSPARATNAPTPRAPAASTTSAPPTSRTRRVT